MKPRYRMAGLAAVFALALAMISAAAPPAAAPVPAKTIKVLVAGVPHDALFGLSFENGSGVAVGAGGSILESSGQPETWIHVAQDASQLALLAVDRRQGRTVAVGQTGTVLVETAPGQWKAVDSGTQMRLLAISINRSGTAVATGEFGAVIKSVDGGLSWTSIAPAWKGIVNVNGGAEPHIYSVNVSDDGEINIAGEFGLIVRSTDGGASWRILHGIDAHAPSIFALLLAPAGGGNSYAVGQSGAILVSTDGGASWRETASGTSANLLGIAASADGRIAVTGMRAMLRSTDAGASWQSVQEGDATTEWYQAVRLDPASGQFIAVGHAGEIIQIGG